MVVGVLRLTMDTSGLGSLKGKRAIVKRIVSRVRQTFNVAVAEVDLQDAHDFAVLGFAVVGSDHRVVNSVIDRVIDFVEEMHLASIEDHSYEILHVL
jgi:uncharacterized protein YlxP (DUF503 family)